jgi:cytochrome c554/c'-like protein
VSEARTYPRARPVLALLLGVLAALAGTVHLKAAPPQEGPASRPAPVNSSGLLVYATGQSLGSLEPCECVEGMAGGLPRRLALLERERKLRSTARLVVDTGDLTGKAFHPQLLEAKTRAALELLARVDTVVAVGDNDLRVGLAKLRELAQASGAALVCANLSEGGRQVFPGSVTRRVSGQTWRVVGLLDPELCPPDLACEDPAQALARELQPGERGIALFHGSAKAAEALGGAKGLELILCGENQQRARPLRLVKGTPLVEIVRDARSVARVELGAKPTLSYLTLDGRIPDDPWARARVDRYYQDVAGLPEPPRKPTPAGGSYIGAQTCGGCHVPQYEVFKKTLHHGAQARVTKSDPKRAKLSECTTCHVTGFGFQGGFTDMKRSPHLAEVGCEACHGVGERHAKKGGGRGFGVKPNFPQSWKPVCLGCHDSTNSPNFDFEKALAKIKHWKDR